MRIQLPFTGFEPRQFEGNPYCYSWYEGDRSQRTSASYVDKSIMVYLIWRVTSDRAIHDPGTELGALFSEANEAVLAGVYEGFGTAA